MKHWIRDLDLSSYIADYDGGNSAASFVIYHFLKNAGWTWLWECDGEDTVPNHCTDGNMEASGVTSWTLSGAGSRAKSATQIKNGTQSLSWVSAASEALTSANFTSLTDTIVYEQVVWIYNNSGNTFVLDVFDGNAYGTGVNLTSTGGWAMYHVTFTKNVAGTAYFRISAPAGAGTIYVDSCSTFHSFFEYNTNGLLADYTDGQIKASNVLASASYTFTSGDIGKVAILWDGTNEGNSGAYVISSVTTGEATLDIRVGGAETLTTTTSLTWRLIDLSYAPKTQLTSTRDSGAGWGLESPYSSANWRIFHRHNLENGNVPLKYIQIWASPKDCDFDPSDGSFYITGDENTQQVDPKWSWNLGCASAGHTVLGAAYATSVTASRLYLMTDDDGTFMTWANRSTATYESYAYAFVGFTGSDSYHTLTESWALQTRYNTVTRNTDECWLQNNTINWGQSGLQPTPSGGMTRCLVGVYSFGGTGLPYSITNAKANPFNSQEWLHKPFLIRDPLGTGNYPNEKEFGDNGIYISRFQTQWTTFDSDEYFHLSKGLCWEWPNVSVVS